MRGQREATRGPGMYVRGDDGGLSSGSETGSASGAGDGGGGGSGGNGAVASQRAGRSAGSSEGAAEEDPSYGEAPGSAGSGGSPHELSLADIQSCFSLGLREAANKLGVCATTLKRHCRKHNIWKWPNRELKKYNRAMAEIQRLHSGSGATLPLPSAIAAVAAAAAGSKGSQDRSPRSIDTQEAKHGAGRAAGPRSTANAARRQRPTKRQGKGTAAGAAAPASPTSVRSHSDRMAARRQPPTPEISDAPSMLGAGTAWTASDSTTPSLNAARTGQGIEEQLAAAGAQHSATHESQQWPPPLLPGPLEQAGCNGPAGQPGAGDPLQLLPLHRQQAVMAMQQAAAQWPAGMQLTHEALAQYQQALPQGGLATSGAQGAWPLELQSGGLNPGALPPGGLEAQMQRWQRQVAQEPPFGHHARGSQPPPQQHQQHWSLSGATEARQQALQQQPLQLQGWQELQQLAAQTGWSEFQADEQLPSQQEQAQDIFRVMADNIKQHQRQQQQLAGLSAAQGSGHAGPQLPQLRSRRSLDQPPTGNSPMAGVQAHQLKTWAEMTKGPLGPDAVLDAGPAATAAPQVPLSSAGAWISSPPQLQGQPMGPHCQEMPAPVSQLPANQPFRPFETAPEGLSMGGGGGPGMPGAAGQPDTWLSRTSGQVEAPGPPNDMPFRQPAGLGVGLPDPGGGFGGQLSHELRHTTGSLEGLLATYWPQAMPSVEDIPESPTG